VSEYTLGPCPPIRAKNLLNTPSPFYGRQDCVCSRRDTSADGSATEGAHPRRSLGWAAVWYAGNLRRGPSLDVGIAAGLPEWAKEGAHPTVSDTFRKLVARTVSSPTQAARQLYLRPNSTRAYTVLTAVKGRRRVEEVLGADWRARTKRVGSKARGAHSVFAHSGSPAAIPTSKLGPRRRFPAYHTAAQPKLKVSETVG
jgi:hypothetical protein